MIVAAKDAHQQSSTVPSLKDLSLKLAIERIVDEEIGFTDVDCRLHALLFGKFRDEISRLKVVERESLRLKEYLPRVDRDIYLPSGRIPDEEDWEQDREENEERGETINPYKEVRIAYDKWSYLSPDEAQASMMGEQYVMWYSSTDLCYDEEEGKFIVQDRFSRMRAFEKYFRLPSLYDIISSQLLLYRITVIFGMPPVDDSVGYKLCWTLTLQHHSGKGYLQFGEWKGGATARFHGSKEASDDALTLLNFLTYVKMPHHYDGIIAGTVA